MNPSVEKVLGLPERRKNIFANYLQNKFSILLRKHSSTSNTFKINPSVQKVFGLSELREPILTYLLFDENQVPVIPYYKVFRLVCKQWLETTNHLIYQNLRNLEDPPNDWIRHIPVRCNYQKIPDFIRLLKKSCLKTAPALPFELELSSFENKLTEGKHHKAITTLLTKFSDGLVKMNIRSPCNLENLHLPNLQILTSIIYSWNIGKGCENDIQTILDGSQNSLHSFTFFICKLSPDARILPIRLPQKLHTLHICSACDILHLETLLSHNIRTISNLQRLYISVSTQTTFSKPELLYQFLSKCPHIKRVYLGRHEYHGLGRDTVVCQLPLPKIMKQLECIELDLFGTILPSEALESSARYPKWEQLKLRAFAKEDLCIWTTYYPCQNLKRLKFDFERQYEDSETKSFGLDMFHLAKIHLAYPNLTYLEIWVENQKSLEYIFSKMSNLKTLHVRHEIHGETYVNWDAVLIGCSPTEIKKLKEDYKKDQNSVIFVPDEDLFSIRNMKALQTLILNGDYPYNVPIEYKVSDVAFCCAFLKMENLVKLEIDLPHRISENVQQIWHQSQPNRGLKVIKWF